MAKISIAKCIKIYFAFLFSWALIRFNIDVHCVYNANSSYGFCGIEMVLLHIQTIFTDVRWQCLDKSSLSVSSTKKKKKSSKCNLIRVIVRIECGSFHALFSDVTIQASKLKSINCTHQRWQLMLVPTRKDQMNHWAKKTSSGHKLIDESKWVAIKLVLRHLLYLWCWMVAAHLNLLHNSDCLMSMCESHKSWLRMV